ncbi:MAG: purine-nucleoside phosphorylase [Oscillospiraceae bacterium]|nr:purine-nucleoside phosphorylase [Oscillospiraceae bacterium]MDY5642307.1 purine-nucleoside phosphorylase [Candidatus Faecousia sp.]
MSQAYALLEKWVRAVREVTDFTPEIGIVLGSGLGDFARLVDRKAEVSYDSLPGFPVSTVAGHAGKLIFGYVRSVPVVVMQGRVHYYEGYSMEQVVAPIRLMGLLGAKKLLLTNAAGGVNTSFTPGDLMLITDHISAFVPSPLRGENPQELGPRFPDMSRVYDKEMGRAVLEAGEKLGESLQQGVYLQWQGPNYETPAEIRMFRTLGADAVGMSTVCEAIAARHMGLRVCAVSCITNMACGILPQPLSHEEVQQTANRVKDKFQALVLESLESFHHLP